MFSCPGGGCVQATAVCDGKKDCVNGEDENNCRTFENFRFDFCGVPSTADTGCRVLEFASSPSVKYKAGSKI